MPSEDGDGPTVDPDRFLPAGHATAGYWSVTPSRFFELPEDRMLAAETSELVNDDYNGYETYQTRATGRTIPVIVLEPRGAIPPIPRTAPDERLVNAARARRAPGSEPATIR